MEVDRRIREFSFDFCFRFPGDEKGAIVTVLVEREQVTGMTLASERNIVAAMYVPDFIRECGAAETEIALKTDEGLRLRHS